MTDDDLVVRKRAVLSEGEVYCSECEGYTEDQCPKCAGKGVCFEIDLKRARSVKDRCKLCRGSGKKPACGKCGGVGVDPATIRNGIRVRELKCQVIVWEKLIENDAAATLELRIYPMVKQGDDGKPRIMLTPSGRPLLWAEIPRMWTQKKYRRKGHMSELLDGARGNIAMAKMVTNWQDSTPSGRAFLLTKGFEHEGQLLTWDRWSGFQETGVSADDGEALKEGDGAEPVGDGVPGELAGEAGAG